MPATDIRRASWIVAMALLAPLARADVLVVAPSPGPGVDFTQIAAAVEAANDGDVVLVRAGSYAPFTVTAKELVVAADSGATVKVDGCVTLARGAAAARVHLLPGVDRGRRGAEGLGGERRARGDHALKGSSGCVLVWRACRCVQPRSSE